MQRQSGSPAEFVSELLNLGSGTAGSDTISLQDWDRAKLLDRLVDTILIHTVQGKFLEVNQTAIDRYGYSREEFLKLSLNDIVPDEITHKISGRLKTLIQDHEILFESTHVTKSGTILPVEINCRLIKYQGIAAALSVVRDISRRVKAREEKLLQANLLDSSINEIYIIDAGTLRFEYANQGALRNLGLTIKQIQSMVLKEIIPSMDEESLQSFIQPLLDGSKESLNVETLHQRKDGTEYPVELRLQLFERDAKRVILAIALDITNRKKAQFEREASSRFLRKVTDTISETLMVINSDYTIALANRTVREIAGVDDPVAAGMTCYSLSHGRSTPCNDSDHPCPLRTIQQTKKRMTLEQLHHDANGRNRYVEIVVEPIFDSDGNVIQIIESGRDITERKREETLVVIRSRLVEYATKHSLSELLTRIIDEVEALTGSKIGFYHFVSEDQKFVSLQAWSTNTMNSGCSVKSEVEYPIAEAGIWVDCIEKKSPVVHNDYANFQGKKGLPKGHVPLVRELVVPVIRKNKIVAILGVGNKATDYDETDIKILHQMAELGWEFIYGIQTSQALRESEEKFRSVLEQSNDAVFIVLHNKLDYFNNRFVEMTGVTREEADSPDFDLLKYIAPESLPKVRDLMTRRDRGEDLPYINSFSILRSDGKLIHTESSLSSIEYMGGRAVLGLMRDVTKLKESEYVISRHVKEQNLLLEISRKISSTLDIELVLQSISDGAAELLQTETAAIYLLQDNDLRLEATTPPIEPGFPEEFRMASLADHPHILQAIETRHPIAIPDTRNAKLSPAEELIVEMRQLRSLLYLPIQHEDHKLGVLILGTNTEPRRYSERDIDLCQTMTNQLALGIQNARLHSELLRYTRELETQIAGRKYFEREREKTLAFLQTIIDGLPECLMVINLDHTIAQANKMVQVVAGGRDPITENLKCFQISHGSESECDSELHPCPLKQVVETKTSVIVEHVHFDAKGNEIPIEVVAAPIFDENGNVFQVVESSRDISQRKQDEADKETLLQQLLHAQKMESIGILAGGVAHDFNNLLTPIIGNTELMMMNLEDGNPLYSNLKEILSTSERARGIVHQLLAFSRKQIMKMKQVDLNVLISNFRSILRHAIREDIIIKMQFSKSPNFVLVDPSQIEQVLMNLCVNATDAMPNGGQITIDTEDFELTRKNLDSFPELKQGSYAVLSIRDTGSGMDSKIQTKIFDPFFTTKGEGKGTGLGLSTVHGIILQHHGIIRLYSEPGKGSTFKIYLPISDTKLQQPAIDKPDSTRTNPILGSEYRGNETILVVEDEEQVRSILVKILSTFGYKVMHKSNAREAISAFDELDSPLDLLLTDIVMPDTNGVELYELLSQRQEHLKVLYVSGYTGATVQQYTSQRKKINLLQKPFSIVSLLSKVREVLDQPAGE